MLIKLRKHNTVMIFTLLFALWTVFSSLYQVANIHAPVNRIDKLAVSTCTAGKKIVQYVTKTCQDAGTNLSGILSGAQSVISFLPGLILMFLIVLIRLPLYPHVIDKPPRLLSA
jgi:Fe2+ transport system protein B